jgi:hypothetical protein
MGLYSIGNFPAPTTAGAAVVTTGTAIKTMLQVQPSATIVAKVKRWWINFSGFAAAAPILCELIETDVAATVTAHVTAGIVKLDGDALAGGDPVTNLIQVGTANTGYTATAEGSIGASRVLDVQQIDPALSPYMYEWALGDEPIIQVSKFLRVRVTAPAAVNCLCGVVLKI